MRINASVFIVLLALSMTGVGFASDEAVSADKGVLIVATDYPPYEFEKPEGDLKGFDVEVAIEAFRRAAYAASVEFYPWPRCLDMVRQGLATAALTCAKNPEREKLFVFSEPISLMTDVLAVHKDYAGPELSRLRELGRHKLLVGAARGTYTEKRLVEYKIPRDISTTEEIVVRKLGDKRIDVMPTTLENFLYLSKKEGAAGQFKWFAMQDAKTSEFHLAFSRKWPGVEELVPEFDRKLEELKQDGTYEAIHAKYR